MNKEGFYSIQYQGPKGQGFGLIALDTGTVVGADVTGGLFDGTYNYNHKTEMLDVKITLTVPAGESLVTGAPPQASEYKTTFESSLPRTLGEEKPIQVNGPENQPIHVVIKKIRDFPE